jgi:hypothetical protein
LTVPRLRFPALCALCAGVLAWGSTAHAAAQVSKFNIVLSANAMTIGAQDFNEKVIDQLNRSILEPRGYEGVKRIKFAWMYDIQGRYFVRPNFAVEAGVSQLRTVSRREFLPAINMSIDYRAELLSVPVHLGGAYYLPAYNQGDFQARWYLGGGFMAQVYNRAKFAAVESRTDPAHTLGGDFKIAARRDSPGFYLDTGVHMFFGGRYSVLLGGIYRSALVRQAEGELETYPNGVRTRVPLGPVFDIDTSGFGAKLALAIGL